MTGQIKNKRQQVQDFVHQLCVRTVLVFGLAATQEEYPTHFGKALSFFTSAGAVKGEEWLGHMRC